MFRLYDTHGFPLDLTQDVARDQGMSVDLAGYQAALAEQKERGRAFAQFGAQGAEGVQVYLDLLRDLKAEGSLPAAGVVQHIYGEDLEVETAVVAFLREGQRVTSVLTPAIRSRWRWPRRRSTSSRAAR